MKVHLAVLRRSSSPCSHASSWRSIEDVLVPVSKRGREKWISKDKTPVQSATGDTASMSTVHSGEDLAASIDDSIQTLREVHERLVAFISAHSVLSNATLRLADSIVEFYSPEDDGFAPAIAFQTMAAEGTSGLICAQIQALVQTALRPLARFTDELSEVDTLVKLCKEAHLRSQHYSKKVSDLNKKIEVEKKEDRRAQLHEKAARNNAKLAAAHRERHEVSEKVYRLVETSQRSRYACFNPVFASICQFQEASHSYAHLLSTMLLRVMKSSLGSSSFPIAAADAPSSPWSPAPKSVEVSSAPGSLSPRSASPRASDPSDGVSAGEDALAAAGGEGACFPLSGVSDEGDVDSEGDLKGVDVGSQDGVVKGKKAEVESDGGVGVGGCAAPEDDNDIHGEHVGDSCSGDNVEQRTRSGNLWRRNGSGDDHLVPIASEQEVGEAPEGLDDGVTTQAEKEQKGRREEVSHEVGGEGATVEVSSSTSSSVATGARIPKLPPESLEVSPRATGSMAEDGAGPASLRDATPGKWLASASEPEPLEVNPTVASETTETTGTEPEARAMGSDVAPVPLGSSVAPTSAPTLPSRQAAKIDAKAVPRGDEGLSPKASATPLDQDDGNACVASAGGSTTRREHREDFLEGHLPWGKRRRMSGMLVRKGTAGSRGSSSTRQVYCVAEGPELLVYDAESDPLMGSPPRARFLVRGARSMPSGRGGHMELEVTVTEEIDAYSAGETRELLAGMMTSQHLVAYTSTRAIVFVAPDRRDHARWALALDGAKGWKEELEREAMLEELELSLPFRAGAMKHLINHLTDAKIEEILGISAAREDPKGVVKSTSFDDAVVATCLVSNSSPENSIGSAGSGSTMPHDSFDVASNSAASFRSRRIRPSFSGLGSAIAAGGHVSGNRRRSSSEHTSGHTSTLRGLFSRFDHGRSAHDHVDKVTSFAATWSGGSSMGFGHGVKSGASGAGGGGGGGASRWSVGGIGKRGSGSRSDTSPPSRPSGYRSPQLRSTLSGGVGPGSTAAAGVRSGGRGLVESVTPMRRRTQTETASTMMGSLAGDAVARAEGGGTLPKVRDSKSPTLDDELGELFSGGGQAVCGSRSRSHTLGSTSVFDIFEELEPCPPRRASVAEGGGGLGAGEEVVAPRSRCTRDRALILRLLGDVSSHSSHTAESDGRGPCHGEKRQQKNSHAGFGGSAGVEGDTPQNSASQSASAPSTPAPRRSMEGAGEGTGRERAGTVGAGGVPVKPHFGNGGTYGGGDSAFLFGAAEREPSLPLMPTWPVLGQQPPGPDTAAGDASPMVRRVMVDASDGAVAGGGAARGLSGINPYLTRRPSAASCGASTDNPASHGSKNGGAAPLRAPDSPSKQWAVWFEKNEMPPLPRKESRSLGSSSSPPPSPSVHDATKVSSSNGAPVTAANGSHRSVSKVFAKSSAAHGAVGAPDLGGMGVRRHAGVT